MTDLLGPASRAVATEDTAPRRSARVDAAVAAGGLAAGAAAALLLGTPAGEPSWVAVGALGAVSAVLLGLLLHRRPWLAPYGAILLFSTSAELRLRVSPAVGVLKDVYVALLVLCVVVHVLRRISALRALDVLAFPGAAFGVLLGLYVLDPGGTHGSGWLFGTRLLVEVLALFLVGFLLSPRESVRHLVRAMTVVLPLEAVLAWAQQRIGADALVFEYGYRFGAQVRLASDGSLRSFGTFEDPFQLAALAVLGLALGLFVASRWQAGVLLVSAVAVLAAASVRTALVQVAVLGLVWAIRRGWWRQAVALCLVGAVAGTFLLATTTVSERPGAPEEPLLLTLNGRSTAWALAVDGWQSFVTGNGVGARGIGSTRSLETPVTEPPRYDPSSEPPALLPGNPAFLDSAYAQVQSDVGIVGTLALLTGLLALSAHLVKRCREVGSATDWAACAVLVASMADWVTRSSLASYTTGFLTLYVLGVLIGAGRTPDGR